MQLRGAAGHCLQRFFRSKINNGCCLWCTDIAEKENLFKNEEHEGWEKRLWLANGPASNFTAVTAAVSAAVAANAEKMNVSPPGILPQTWLIWFYHQDRSSHWFRAGTILGSYILPPLRTGSPPPAPSRWSVTRSIQYVLDISPTDFFLFTKVDEQLAGLSFAQESLKKTWVGVSKSITAETFAVAFRRWFEWRKKCVCIGGDHVISCFISYNQSGILKEYFNCLQYTTINTVPKSNMNLRTKSEPVTAAAGACPAIVYIVCNTVHTSVR